MPRIKKQKKHLNSIRERAANRGNVLLGYVRNCLGQLDNLLQERGHVKILNHLNLYIKDKNMCSWDLSAAKKRNQTRASDSHVKRINGSQMYQVSARDRIVKFRAYGSREKSIKERWLEHFSFNENNFIDEVFICRPDKPLLCGIMDGLLKINGEIVVVEFKGILKKEPCLVGNELRDNSSEIQQCLFYSFLNDWKDVLLVYGLTGNRSRIFTKFLNFSQLKPFKAELEAASNDYFLTYFTKNILIWKLLNNIRLRLGFAQQEIIKKKCEKLCDVVKSFNDVHKGKKGVLIYPELTNIRRNLEKWEII